MAKTVSGVRRALFGTTTTQMAALVVLWGEPAAKKFLDAIKTPATVSPRAPDGGEC